jgi:hypothetical protein
LAAFVATVAATAPAVGAPPTERGSDYRLFNYVEAPAAARYEPNYFRLTLEELGILAVGSIEYFQNQNMNEGDWDLPFSSDSFEDKVAGRAITFDGNKFGTNWISHPLGGWLYYGAARGNRLGPLESLFVASIASATWEFIGEFREQASINDLMVTPLGGAALSEPLMQLGGWFERGRPTTARTILATVLAPTKRVHDALDSLEPRRVAEVPRGALDARIYAAGGSTWEDGAERGRAELTAGFRSDLFNGPNPHAPGNVRAWLNDGNLSAIRFGATLGDGRLVDARFGTRVSFVGYLDKHVDEMAARPYGHTLFLGLGTGIDYQWHSYTRDASREDDAIALIELLGSTLENWHVAGSFRLHTRLALSFDFAGVTSLALSDRVHTYGTDGLPTVLSANGYTHALGGTIAPMFVLQWPAVKLFGEARLDVFRSVIDRDRYHDRYTATVEGADERFEATAGVSRTITPGIDLGIGASRLFRRSRLDEVTRSFGETRLRLQAAVTF